ncbi:FtsX-like permease family protein [Massilicoli timonensis]|uniref:FtsX-like permease family protein n=1 Tax=Massilicoli timonensis TaxID=2015901 RepID=A0ABT1SLF3_9FIRM|nr:FtsX-like permease family protein [Massilicoli timonensis]MCQ5121920.1 FtsX-like permease family protein [Massilicoli timonensis]
MRYIFKNALLSITRNKGRNLLIGILILVISCAVSVALAIDHASAALIASYEDKYEVEATIAMNRENMMQNFDPENREDAKADMNEVFQTASSITAADIEAYADSDYVKSYYYTMNTEMNAVSLEKAEQSMEGMPQQKRGDQEFEEMASGDFTLQGYSSLSAMNEFIEGSYQIVDGEVASDFESDTCLLNEELATLNDIQVGDQITLVDPNDETITYSLTVSGIYQEQSERENGMKQFANSVNTIITNAHVVEQISAASESLRVSITPTFILTDSSVVDAFSAELSEKGLSEYLSVQTNLDQVESATSTIANVQTFSVTFLIITFIIGTIVLLIVNFINIRERKYEIGVLRTIGMKKSKVCLQFISELLIVSLLSLLLGAGIGAAISVPVSNYMLENEIASAQNEQQSIRDHFGGNGKEMIPDQGEMPEQSPDMGKNNFQGVIELQAFDSIDAVVDIQVVIQLLGIGLALTVISSLSAMISIQRFSPLTILKERT